jgi:hypothetical protein
MAARPATSEPPELQMALICVNRNEGQERHFRRVSDGDDRIVEDA